MNLRRFNRALEHRTLPNCKACQIVHIFYTDDLCRDLSNNIVSRAQSKSLLGQDRAILFRLLAPALGSSATLDSLSLRPVDVVRRNPAFVVRLRTRSDRRSIGSNHRNLIGGIDFLRLAR